VGEARLAAAAHLLCGQLQPPLLELVDLVLQPRLVLALWSQPTRMLLLLLLRP
jgi:hypothetical protein